MEDNKRKVVDVIKREKTRNIEPMPESASIYKTTQPSYIKRLASFVLDLVLFLILATGIGFLTSLALDTTGNLNNLHTKYVEHGVYVLNDSSEYIYCDTTKEECKNAWLEFNRDEVACSYYDKMVNDSLIITTVGASVSLLILEFAVPLLFKNGMTVGKKILNITLIDKRGIRVKNIQIFARCVIGKIGFVALVPTYMLIFSFFNIGGGLLGTLIFAAIELTNLCMLGLTPNHIGISDAIGGVYPVDNSTQIYFDTVEELNDAKCKEEEEYIKTAKVKD